MVKCHDSKDENALPQSKKFFAKSELSFVGKNWYPTCNVLQNYNPDIERTITGYNIDPREATPGQLKGCCIIPCAVSHCRICDLYKRRMGRFLPPAKGRPGEIITFSCEKIEFGSSVK